MTLFPSGLPYRRTVLPPFSRGPPRPSGASDRKAVGAHSGASLLQAGSFLNTEALVPLSFEAETILRSRRVQGPWCWEFGESDYLGVLG